MGRKGCTGVILALSLLANVFCLPPPLLRVKRQLDSDNEIVKRDSVSPSTVNLDLPPPVPYNNDDDDDDFNIPDKYPSSNGGSNIVSLLKLATGLLSGSSGSSKLLLRLIKEIVNRNKPSIILERKDLSGNEINIDYKPDFKPPPFEKQRDGNGNDSSSSDSNESENVAAEESLEDDSNDSGRDSDSNVDDSDDDNNSDYDEPPGGGDGQGGGILGLLAGLSGGEDGQSDLGSLLATIGGIVANLSGDGIDLNALIASGIGLFVGLLSEGEENPGEILASYLLTSLDTITGGGAKNNGAVFGKFLSKLVKGTSAAGDPDASSEEANNNMKMADSAGFFLSLITSLLGDMSKSSSGSNSWRRNFND
ncbi:uncharacterized protein LOC123663622 [Melitaea cinxia]|uniref:uncharacterized protein LOC123663622 n=1 Tax=Melitaea cinxia TaxID=113334 RepID=UPI001E270499|nr:uncharacterized protein LOC123663622 [Melitaea cinxia]